ncbi:MAG: restriction endonuclease [Terricaulis sp.]
MSSANTIASEAAPVSASRARFIKLGSGGRFAKACFAGGYVGLNFRELPHDLCRQNDWDALHARFCENGKSPRVASNFVRELRDFYTLGRDALWVTFAQGRLWWTFAEVEVAWCDPASDQLPRQRKCVGGWSSTDTLGTPLFIRELSTRLTQVARYQGTICDISDTNYLLRRLNGVEEPLAAEAAALRHELIVLTERLLVALHWKDFEILVDLIFSASGWRRIGVLGETQADSDLILEQIATGERAFVQVKSKANPAILADYVERFRASGDCNRMFFVCHSPTDAIHSAQECSDIDIWTSRQLASKVVQSGLFDWVVTRVR